MPTSTPHTISFKYISYRALDYRITISRSLSLSLSRWHYPCALSPCKASKSIREGFKSAQVYGLNVNSVESIHKIPGSPECLTDSINLAYSSNVVSFRMSTAELLLRPRCGFATYQSPVLAFIISASSLENIQMVALLRTNYPQVSKWVGLSLNFSISKPRISRTDYCLIYSLSSL